MKMTSLDSKKENELYLEARYNDNTKGNHISITKGNTNQDKKDTAVLSIVSLMGYLGYYDEAASSVNGSGLDVMNKMIDNATKKVNKTFLQENGGLQL